MYAQLWTKDLTGWRQTNIQWALFGGKYGASY
jgi:hypothetical protein